MRGRGSLVWGRGRQSRRRGRCALALASVAAAGTACALAAAPAPAAANPVNRLCTVAGLISGAAGKACTVLQKGAGLLSKGKAVVSGSGGAAKGALGLAAIGAWVLVGAKVALHETAAMIAHTTSPQLSTTWFSATYWQMAAIAALLTLPFLFAAAVQAVLRSDLALLLRAALGYLPLALLAVGIAAPVTMLLLSASDEMCALVSSAAGDAGTHFLARAGAIVGGVALVSTSPFIAFVIGLFTVTGAVALWAELLMREAAVYVVVLMLPLAFAALVWPARRVWAIRAVELLVALILSKFAMVAVLVLGAAALARGPSNGIAGTLTGAVLVTMAAFAPWALVRLVPLAELAAGAAGSLRGDVGRGGRAGAWAAGAADGLSAALARGEDPAEYGELAGEDAARSETRRLAELAPVPVAGESGADRDPANDSRVAAGLPAGGGAGSGAMEPSAPDGSPAEEDGDLDARGRAGAAAHGPEQPARPGPPAVPGDTTQGWVGSAGPGAGSAGPDAGSTGASHDSAGPSSGSTGLSPAPTERAPGLPSIFQQDDETWPVLELGLGDGWPPPPLPGRDEDPGAGGPTTDDARGGGEDHDPRPPIPESEDGRL